MGGVEILGMDPGAPSWGGADTAPSWGGGGGGVLIQLPVGRWGGGVLIQLPVGVGGADRTPSWWGGGADTTRAARAMRSRSSGTHQDIVLFTNMFNTPIYTCVRYRVCIILPNASILPPFCYI